MSKRNLNESNANTPSIAVGKSPGLFNGQDNPLSKRLSRRKLSERAASFIDSQEEQRERARANDRKSRSVLQHKRNEIGETIYKKHPGWVLMMDIQTGLRQSVGRSGELSFQDERKAIEDNLSRHAKFFSTPPELTFPPEGSTMTQPHKTELFKFKNYCPLAFGHLRQKFGVDPGDYMVSLCNTVDDSGTNALRILPTPGKSGSMFFFSQDTKYIIKTIPKSEAKLLRNLLPYYYQHVMQNTNTLLPRFYGLHRVKSSRGAPVRLLIMGNVFQTNKKIHQRYDLKGSLFGRAATQEEVEVQKENVTYKDVDWRAQKKTVMLPRELSELFINQLDSDCLFLSQRDIMDYSMLVGIHDCTVDPENDCAPSCREKRKYAKRTYNIQSNHPLVNPNLVNADGDPESTGQIPISRGESEKVAATNGAAASHTNGAAAPHTNGAEAPQLHGASSTNGPTEEATVHTTTTDAEGNTLIRSTTTHSNENGTSATMQETKNVRFSDSVKGGRDHSNTNGSFHSTTTIEEGTSGSGKLFRVISTFSTLRRNTGPETQEIVTGGFVNEKLRREVNHSEGKTIAQTNYPLPEQYQNVDGGCVFQLDEGGMWSADGNLQYFIGIIDILMLYSFRKKMEHFYKSTLYSAEDISAVNPVKYAERFLGFMRDIVPEL